MTGLVALGGAAVLAATVSVPSAVAGPTPAPASPPAAPSAAPPAAGPERYSALSRPFAIPGFKEQEFNGALFVGKGETRFSTSVSMVAFDDKVIHENMVPSIWSLGPVATDGSYYEIHLSTDDRVITRARLDALHETIAHPESWTAEEVAAAQAQLPALQERFDQVQSHRQDLVIRYARVAADELVGSFTATADDTTVFLDASAPWAEPSTYAVRGARSLVGTSAGLRDASKVGHFRVDANQAPDSASAYATLADMIADMGNKPTNAGNGAAALRYSLDAGESVTFTARMGTKDLPAATRTPAQVNQALNRAKAAVDDTSVHGAGPAGAAISDMRDAMAMNTNYDEKFDRAFQMWGLGGGGDDIFQGWDSGWDAVTAAELDPALAVDHLKDLMDHGGSRYDQLNAGPMHTYAAWRVFQRTGDRSVLDLVYEPMKAYIARMPEFDVDGDGLLESPWVEDRPGGRGNHLGLDDSPQFYGYSEVPRDGGTDDRENTDLTDVPLNSYYGLFAHTMGQIARELGHPDEATAYDRLFTTLKTQMNKRLWNSERGLYLNRYLDGRWEPTNTPTVFYPLFGGLATPDRARILVEDHLENPAEYGGEYIIPSVARNDPAFCASGTVHPESEHFRYFQSQGEEDACEEWQGAVWPPMNATVYDGLKRYGFDASAARLATKSTALWESTWDELGWFPEYWDPEPGQSINGAATDTTWRTYSWSNLMPLMTANELFGDDAWGTGFRFGTLGLPGTNTISEVPWRGSRYDVTASPTHTELVRDGTRIFSAQGGRVVVRDYVQATRSVSFEVTASKQTALTVRMADGTSKRLTVPKGVTRVRL